jgi:hypothetical protein
MATAVDYPTQLSTTVKNTSGGRRFFGYLNRHGLWLNDDATHIEFGDLNAKFSGRRPYDRTMRDAIAKDLQNDNLLILQTPRAIDAGSAGTPVGLAVSSGGSFETDTLTYST